MAPTLGLALAATVLLAFALWRRTRPGLERQNAEDALKHLFEQEYRGRSATLSSLTGALHLSDRAAIKLIGRMHDQGLVRTEGQSFRLSREGERLALRIVRAHRLLERYFADEARLPLKRVHAAAERREHALTPEAADRLSASLGHPAQDPHGDPIPTKDGELPAATGTPATAWPAKTPGRIVHLEDEPDIAFAQIVAAGLRVGQTVQLEEVTPRRVVLSDGTREYALAPAVAANVFLAPASAEELSRGLLSLADLADDETAEVVGLDPACQGFSRRRLMDLGFTVGAPVRPALRTFAGDPRAYEIRGTLVALRRDQAGYVLVRRQTPEEAARLEAI